MTGVMERAVGEKRTSAHTKEGERAQPHKSKDPTDTELKTQKRERELSL
jgi:hypothetical protein